MRVIAQTNLQLYNQLRLQGREDSQLALAKRAYDLSALLYAGYYQGDGKPFVAHTVGVASILAWLDLPGEVVAFGALHNVYGNGDFGDGLQHATTPARRSRVRVAAGAVVEDMVYRFRDFRISSKTVDRIEGELDRMGEVERHMVLADLADYLEKYVDLGVQYFGDSNWITTEIDQLGARLIAVSERLEQPLLAEMMREAFAAASKQPGPPQELRNTGGRHITLTLPLSARPRLGPITRVWLRRQRRRVGRRLSRMIAAAPKP